MKIGILTQPLLYNYGGILQAFALQKVLKDMGHDVYTIDSQFKDQSYREYLIILFKRFVLKHLYRRKDIETVVPIRASSAELKLIRQNFNTFKLTYMSLTKQTTLEDLKKIVEEHNFQALVVGSDQVWRPKYSPNIEAFFLAGLKKKTNLKRIAYSASFGTDVWEFSKKQTSDFSQLLKLFDLVTVREESAVQLCEKQLGVEASVVLDPTLLIRAETYTELFTDKIKSTKEEYILIYVLDESQELLEAVERLAEELRCRLKFIKPEERLKKGFENNLNNYILPPVEQWVNDIKNARFVVTDSYHGSIFSIMFQKQFLSLGNKKRGLSRFESLFNLLELQNRLILNPIDMTSGKLLNEIDYDSVKSILDEEREKSINLLTKYLKN